MVTLNKPSGGDTNWATPVNDNWTTIENSLGLGICEGRLTLTSGNAVPTSEVFSATSVYFTPYKGNRIGVYSGATWVIYSFTQRSLALAGLFANVTYDVFIYDNSGTLTLEVQAWKAVTAGNSPTSGANKVISVADTAGVAVGSWVTVKDGVNNEIARVNAVALNASITVDALVSSYTTPDVYYPSRAADLTIQDGIYVKSGVSTRRYLGSLRTSAVTGQCEDSLAKRFIWNYYHRKARVLIAQKSDVASWTYNSATWRAPNGDTTTGRTRVEFVLGLSEDAIEAHIQATIICAPYYHATVGVGLDSTTVPVDQTRGAGGSAGMYTGPDDNVTSSYLGFPGQGWHFLQWIESVGSGTTTYFGTGLASIQSGLVAKMMG